MEKFQHTFGRLLAAAAFVGGAVASAPSSGLTITVNGTCSASCSGIPGISRTIVLPVSWQTTIGTGFTTSKAGSLSPGTAAVFVVDIPAGASSRGTQGSFRISPSNANGYNTRILSVSDRPCDYSRSLGTASVVQGQDVRVYFTVGGHATDKYGRMITTIADLTPGNRYYFTVVNQYSVGGANSCMSSACDINYGLTPGT
jgi:hypothetical protein